MYTRKEDQGIMGRTKRGDSKASLFRQFAFPGGTVRGWLKEEDKLRLSVDQVGDKLDLHRKEGGVVV
jgi:hypothetical protein